MRNKNLFSAVALACAVAGLATVGCANNSSARKAKSAGETLTLCIPDTFSWESVATCKQGGWWKQTYNGNMTSFNIGSFVLSHHSGFDVYSYWGGFTVANNGDSLCYSDPTYCKPSCGCRPSEWCDSVGSGGWILNQWGVMAGNGLPCPASDLPVANDTFPYLVAYWDYYSEKGGTHSLEIKLNGDSLFTPEEIYICNHPWPYYGNIYGDGFADSMDTDGDHFYLWIHAVYDDKINSEDSIFYALAEYEGRLYQPDNWTPISLAEFKKEGKSVKSLYFTMETTDVGEYGPNTALYFCLDKLKVTKTGEVASAKTTKTTKTTTAAVKRYEVRDKMQLTSHGGGEVVVFDAKGKKVLETRLKAGGGSIDLSKLPAGDYRVRHGHKAIPVTKVK